jgi:hypothetical protein
MAQMRQPSPSLGEIVRQSAELARQLADTARMHHEPDVALRFEEIAAAADGRARHLDEIAIRCTRPLRWWVRARD